MTHCVVPFSSSLHKMMIESESSSLNLKTGCNRLLGCVWQCKRRFNRLLSLLCSSFFFRSCCVCLFFVTAIFDASSVVIFRAASNWNKTKLSKNLTIPMSCNRIFRSSSSSVNLPGIQSFVFLRRCFSVGFPEQQIRKNNFQILVHCSTHFGLSVVCWEKKQRRTCKQNEQPEVHWH